MSKPISISKTQRKKKAELSPAEMVDKIEEAMVEVKESWLRAFGFALIAGFFSGLGFDCIAAIADCNYFTSAL